MALGISAIKAIVALVAPVTWVDTEDSNLAVEECTFIFM